MSAVRNENISKWVLCTYFCISYTCLCVLDACCVYFVIFWYVGLYVNMFWYIFLFVATLGQLLNSCWQLSSTPTLSAATYLLSNGYWTWFTHGLSNTKSMLTIIQRLFVEILIAKAFLDLLFTVCWPPHDRSSQTSCWAGRFRLCDTQALTHIILERTHVDRSNSNGVGA